jgi:hypothetical protein
MSDARYVIITPAHNEEGLIGQTIEAVIAQTLRPLCWVIVNDGSTDGTGDIVQPYVEKYPFIHLLSLRRRAERNFGKKAIAFRRGAGMIRSLDYGFIGNLDADIVVEPDYYMGIIQRFEEDPQLGIGGGIVYARVGNRFSTSDWSLGSVGGAVQLFRRACYEAIGGYMPLEYGGIDAAAEIKARMAGWKVRKFPEHKVFEQRRTGSAEARPLKARALLGRRFYTLGYAPLFYVARCFYRMTDAPFLVGSMAELYGFVECILRRRPILLSPDVVRYLRGEQRQRLKALPSRLFGSRRLEQEIR